MNYFTVIIFIFSIISIFVVVFLERKRPSDALGWIIIISILPGIGLLLYLMFGDTISMNMHFKYYKNQQLEKLVNEELDNQKQLINKNKKLIDQQSYDYYKDIILMLNNQSKSICSFDNQIDIITDGNIKYQQLFKDIEEAKESISVAYYIISNNQIGWDFMELLTKKAKEGVEVRLIYDFLGGLFIHLRNKHYLDNLKKASGQVYRFLPSFLSSIFRINYRYHRKIVVIDGVIGYTGGFNIGDEYLGKRKKCSPWRDTHLRIQGSAVTDLQLLFLKDWNLIQRHLNRNNNNLPFQPTSYLHLFKEPLIDQRKKQVAMQIVHCGPEEQGEEIKDSYIKMINKATKYIYIQTPYFIPDESIMTALRLAINSGTDVRIMIPGIPDKKFVYSTSLSYIYDFLEIGGKVYMYNGFIHAKSIVIDDFVSTIGSTNIDVRSFVLDFEVNAFIYDEEVAKENKEIFIKDLENSKVYTLDDYKKRTIIKRATGMILRLFSALM